MNRFVPALLLTILVLFAFWPALNGPLVHDDLPNLHRIKVGDASVESAADVATRNPSGLLRRPISNLSLAGNYWLHGMQPWGFKFTNLLIHMICGGLMFLLGRRVLTLAHPNSTAHWRIMVALGAAAIWLLHPLQVSTVMYVVQRMAQLSTLFLLLACLVWSNWLVAQDFGVRATSRMLLKAIALVVAATLSKENGALFPLLFGLLAWLWWEQARPVGKPIPAGFRFGVHVLVLAPILAGLAVLAVSPELALGSYATRDFSLSERLATQGKILWFYVRLFLLPTPSAMGLFHDDIEVLSPGSLQAMLAWGAWLAAFSVAVLARKRAPLLSFAVIWFVCAHAMESSFFGLELAYEHRNYLALFGPALAISAGLHRLLDRAARQRVRAFGLLVLILATLTFSRSVQWSDTQRFFAGEFRNHPDSPRALLSEVARHHALGAPAEWYVAQVPRLRAAHGDAIWPLLIHASLQCSNPDHPVPWQLIEQEIRSGSETFQLDSQAKVVVGRLVENKCPHLDTRSFLAFLHLARLRAQADGDRALARGFSTYLAWTHREIGNRDDAETWFRQAAAEAPPARVEEWFELAYFLLNQGAADQVPEVIDAIELRRQKFRLPIGYRINEIRQHYATLLQESGVPEA